MKNLINYYYGFDLIHLRNVDNNYYFSYKNNNYCFYRVVNNEFKYELNLLNKLKGNPYIHTVVLNKENQILTYDGKFYYILFRINLKQDRKIEVDDILAFKEFTLGYDLKEFSMFNWVEMWSKKIDYIEYYINNKDNITSEIKCIFNYFIGMGENAILYVKYAMTQSEKDSISDFIILSHKRIEYDYTLSELYNPLNFIVDYSVRDIAEYLKSLFYNKKYTDNKIDEIIKKTNYSKFGYIMLISRILFPTFFFDLLDECDQKEFSYDSVMQIYDYVSEYEKFIIYIFYSITEIKKVSLPEISWLKK